MYTDNLNEKSKQMLKDEIQKLKAIDDSLDIVMFNSVDGNLVGLTVKIDVKGNNRLINELVSAGWVKTRRSKVRTDRGWQPVQYSGYTMEQTLTKSLHGLF